MGVGRPVIGLTRHSGTESASSGASPGTRLLFTTLERALAERSRLRLLPAYYYGAPGRLAVGMAEELLDGRTRRPHRLPTASSSTADAAVYRRLVATTPARTCVLPFGIDPSPYRGAATTRASLREAGKLMGLAPYGDPRRHHDLETVRMTPDGDLVIDFAALYRRFTRPT